MNEERTIAHIREAFQGVRCPDDFMRSKPFGADLHSTLDFLGKSWEAISADIDFLCTHSSFSFLTPEGFCYFLPGYMIGAVNYPNLALDFFIDSMFWVLSPPDWAVEAVAYHRQVLDVLTILQKQSIEVWLNHLLATTPEDWWAEPDPPHHRLRRALAAIRPSG